MEVPRTLFLVRIPFRYLNMLAFDGRNPANQLRVGSLSHYLQGF